MRPDEFDLPTSGGALRISRWPSASGVSGKPVIAVHGITANAFSFGALADELAASGDEPARSVDLIAPDLRGRAASGKVGGPYGLATHADDLAALMDHLGIGQATIVGHSMGAFVAALTAVRHPERVKSVLLVDGGVAFGAVPPGADLDAILEAVIGPAIRRLQMTFESQQSYVDFWKAHPSLRDNWSPWIEAYALRDLDGNRSACNIEAIRADGYDTLVNEETTTAYKHLKCPAAMLWAERGMLDEPTGLYNESTVPAQLNPVKVNGVNHYTIVASPRGASAIAEQLTALL